MFLDVLMISGLWVILHGIIIGDLFVGTTFFVLSSIFYFLLSDYFCKLASHYTDGMFLGSTLILLAVMMIYKYWDSITYDDLEFKIGGNPSLWHKSEHLFKSDFDNMESLTINKSKESLDLLEDNEEISLSGQNQTILNRSFFY